MTLQDFQDAFILFLSGQIEKDGSVKWQNEWDREVFITFPTLTPNETIVRQYYENGNKNLECEYRYGLKHGDELMWRKNGSKYSEYEWMDGDFVRSVYYNRDGKQIK